MSNSWRLNAVAWVNDCSPGSHAAVSAQVAVVVTAATKQVDQARVEVRAYEAIVKRWDREVKRLTTMVAKQVVNVEVLSETRRQLESDQARLEASQVAVLTCDAERLAAEATAERTEAGIGTDDAGVPVAEDARWRPWWKAVLDGTACPNLYSYVTIGRVAPLSSCLQVCRHVAIDYRSVDLHGSFSDGK